MIIEKIDRSGHVLDVHAFSGNQVIIGRGYDNDLILHDRYSDEKHVKIEYDYLRDHFVVTDLDSLNGVSRLKKHKHRPMHATGKQFTANSGDAILVGKSRLRLLTKSHSVAPAKLLSGLDALLSSIGSWWFLIAITLALLATEALGAYFVNPFNEKIYKEMIQGLYVLFAAIGYGGIWALVARTQRQDGRLLMHMNLLLLLSVLTSVYVFLIPVLQFNLEWLMYRSYFSKALLGIGLFMAIYASCYQSTNLSIIPRTFVSLLLPSLVFLGTLVSELNRPEFRSQPPYNVVLVSPGWQWRTGISESDFLIETDSLYLPAEEE